MKSLLYIFLTFTLCSSCFAQSTLKDGEYKYDSKIFKVKKNTCLDRSMFSVRALGRFENKRTPRPKDPNGFPMDKKDIHVDINKVKEIIIKVLTTNIKELEKNKDRIGLSFEFLSENGEVESILYGLNGNTLITLKEISKIDKKLKRILKLLLRVRNITTSTLFLMEKLV